MKIVQNLTLTVTILFLSIGCTLEQSPKKFDSTNSNLTYKGRVDKLENETVLISSASSVTTKIIGNTCLVHLKNNSLELNYVSIEVNGTIIDRFKVATDSITAYPIALNPEIKEHIVTIYKATEASTGSLSFSGFTAKNIEKTEESNTLKIEFIGDSITCAAGAENEAMPCSQGLYYDHSDAYNSYGSIAGRTLNADVVLNSVSGIGIYRFWNSTNEKPTMPEAYKNLYLNENPKPYDFSSFQADIISICLGTNDFSGGDGLKERLPFDSEVFTKTYIDFLNEIFTINPNAKIILLDSPMIRDEGKIIFNKCLESIKTHFADVMPEKSITTFSFDSEIYPHGCGFHPSKKDHQQMSEQLVPVLKSLL